MPVKLYYFNSRGRAEGCRYVLAQTGIDYDDVRMDKADWPAFKPKTPQGKVPVLDDDGKMLGQSVAIGRYLARKHHLAGENVWESALCDMYVDQLGDIGPKLRPARMAANKDDKVKAKEEMDNLMKEAMPDFLKTFEKALTENGSGWLVGKQVTWADLFVAEMMARTAEFIPTLLDAYPHLKAFVAKVHALPAIKAYVDQRPVTAN